MLNLLAIKAFYKYLNLTIFGTFLLISCKKNTVSVPYDVIETPQANPINKSFWFNASNGFICGGNKNQNGFIYATTNGGKTWSKSLVCEGTSLFDIYFFSDSLGYCCGDNVTLYKTIDKGINWMKVDLTGHYDDFYKGTLRRIIPRDNSFVIVGGQHNHVGIIISFQHQLIKAGFMGTNNELRSAFAFNDTNYVCCGYGTAYQSKNNLSTYTPIKITDDFLTDCFTLNETSGYTCGYNGGIYKIINGGSKTEKVKDHNRIYKTRNNFTGLYFKNEAEGWVVGNKGILYHTKNGSDFDELKISETSNFLSIVSNKNGELIVSTSDGKLIRFSE